MPEGDTISGAAGRIRGALVGKEIASIETPHPRFERDRWPERLSGRAVRAVDSKGKHLFIRFDGELTLHSHLRMTGSWRVIDSGARWGGSGRTWLRIRRGDREVLQLGGPVLELMTDSRSRFDHRIARLGPDILDDEFDDDGFLRRLREDDPSRGIGDALLDQRNVCGIGNLWKSEACFLAGLDPWKPAGEVSDAGALAAVHAVRPLMLRSAQGGGHVREPCVFERHGRPCRRCGTTIRARGQGDDNRTTYWCPACQA